jgi:mRNA interferase MazF
MAGFVKGDVVIIPFPFSDLTGSKKRPALVLADLPGNDIILCQVTSQNNNDPNAIMITQADFSTGGLQITSYVRPARIFTADKSIIVRKTGTVGAIVITKVKQTLSKLLL